MSSRANVLSAAKDGRPGTHFEVWSRWVRPHAGAPDLRSASHRLAGMTIWANQKSSNPGPIVGVSCPDHGFAGIKGGVVNRKLLLIDYENIQNFDLSLLGEEVDVVIFVGAKQTITSKLSVPAKKLGGRVQWQKIEGSGPNALDFHIACFLGRILERGEERDCYVLSNDTGFDPLLKYLGKQGLSCRRIDHIAPVAAAPSPSDEPNFKKVVDALRKRPKPQRPRDRTALIKFIAALFQKKITVMQVNAIIARLIKAKLLSLQDDTVSYG